MTAGRRADKLGCFAGQFEARWRTPGVKNLPNDHFDWDRGKKYLPDDRSLLARAASRASDAMVVGVEMVAPILLGAWLDNRWGTRGLLATVGGVLGVSLGLWTLVRMVDRVRHPTGDRKNHPPDLSP